MTRLMEKNGLEFGDVSRVASPGTSANPFGNREAELQHKRKSYFREIRGVQ